MSIWEQRLKLRLLGAARRSSPLGRLAGHAGRRRARFLVDPWAAALPAASSLLDVGCGVGFVAGRLRSLGHRVVGLDLVDKRLAAIPFARGRAERLPFARGAVDFVLFCGVLHHIDAGAHRSILAEARRVARRGVVLVEDVFGSAAGLALTKLVDRALNLELADHPHANRRTREWLALLAACGFEPGPVREWRHRPRGLFPLRHAAIMAFR
jgi:SAM-dependent methyltransferase